MNESEPRPIGWHNRGLHYEQSFGQRLDKPPDQGDMYRRHGRGEDNKANLDEDILARIKDPVFHQLLAELGLDRKTLSILADAFEPITQHLFQKAARQKSGPNDQRPLDV